MYIYIGYIYIYSIYTVYIYISQYIKGIWMNIKGIMITNPRKTLSSDVSGGFCVIAFWPGG